MFFSIILCVIVLMSCVGLCICVLPAWRNKRIIIIIIMIIIIIIIIIQMTSIRPACIERLGPGSIKVGRLHKGSEQCN